MTEMITYRNEGFYGTRFTIDDYAGAALTEHCEYIAEDIDDNDVVLAIAQHVFSGFLNDTESEETIEDLERYFDAADAWCHSVGEFDDEEKAEFLKIGRNLLADRLAEEKILAEIHEDLCNATED